jgi:hypothetical protein
MKKKKVKHVCEHCDGTGKCSECGGKYPYCMSCNYTGKCGCVRGKKHAAKWF